MMFDAKHLGLVDAVIAEEIAQHLDDGQPKAKLSDSLKRGFSRIMGRSEAAQTDLGAKNPSAAQEPVKNWV